MEAPPIQHRSHESEVGCWQIVSREPHPLLRSYVRSYEAYSERGLSFRARLEVPHPGVVVILTFGPRLRSLFKGEPSQSAEHGSFVAGMHDAHVLVEQVGPSDGVQVNLTPLGAYAVLGVPMAELTNRTLCLEDLLGSSAEQLVETMREADGWAERMALIDQFVFRRLSRARMPSEGVAWAWHRLRKSGGNASIGSLAETVGCSQKHLIGQFRDQVGLAPKTAARVIRFDRAVTLIERGSQRLVDVAAECGYYDQAHFTREFSAFAGCSPADFASRLLPSEGGVVGDAR
jgi:AraC-like DNA-binding protein